MGGEGSGEDLSLVPPGVGLDGPQGCTHVCNMPADAIRFPSSSAAVRTEGLVFGPTTAITVRIPNIWRDLHRLDPAVGRLISIPLTAQSHF